MKQVDIKDMSSDDLSEKLIEQRNLLVKFRMSHAVSPLENPNQIGEVRKSIARINTELQKRTLEAASKN
jgi:large subunit ribosomal protein L29